ncbi:PREDICTED: aminopeptidase N-like, partial [Ceratosolen solmsi marchali]|uniref:Aminopeptidase N-like n=1 Tax=Ceratosolen solmsi marchali TaxID=326594 RepID=A0AAJ7DVQ4_9HYME
MRTWTNSELYPIINVTRNYTTGSIKITQMPATILFGITERNNTSKWYIPINYATQSNPNFNLTFPSHWLKPDTKRLMINGVNPKDWIILNNQQTGYYRVLYDEQNWIRLATLLNSDNYQKIPPLNRAQIINDAVQFSLKKLLDVKIFLNLVSYLHRETDYIPWYDAQFIFSFLNYHLSNTQAHDSLKKFCLRLIVPLVDKIGFEDRVDDNFSTLLLRRIGNHWACHFGYKNCWNNATKQLEDYLCNKKPKSELVDLQEWARCYGLNGANETIWNKMLQKYQENLSENTIIYLSCSENSTILHNFLNLTISNNSIINEKHVLSVFKSVCFFQSGDDKRINLCLNFINDKFDDVKLRLGNSTQSFTYLLDLLASEIRQKQQLQHFKKILAQEESIVISNKLNSRIKQIENSITVFEQKASYYEPYLKE